MKKLIASLFMVSFLGITAFAEDAIFSIDADNAGFGGGVDYVSSDKIANKYAPIDGILNVNTDRYNEITKKYGSVAYNTTALTGSKKIRRAYVYNQEDGDSYIIAQSSYAIFSTRGDGTFSTVITTLSDTADCDFTTAENCLFWTDATHTPGKWNGTTHTAFTVTNSTNYPTYCKYIINWRSRNWLFGDTRYPTRIYYSEPYVIGIDTGAYANYPIANYVDFGVPDGDLPTGLQVAQGKLYAYFQKKIFEVVELNTGIFGYKLLSNNIGCLYNTTLDILNGFPTFVSHRGLEQFDGSQFELKSLSIDFYVKGLRQLQTQQSVWIQTTAGDWGAGSGTNIDTTTYSGSVAIVEITTSTAYTSSIISTSSSLGIIGTSPIFTVMMRQKIIPTSDLFVVGVAGHSSAETTNLCDLSMNELSLPQKLTQGNTYYLYCVGYYGDNLSYCLEDSYSYSTGEYSTTNDYVWHSFASNRDLYFAIYCANITSATFTSQNLSATSWGSWGTFSVDETVPSGSSINYWAITATSTYNLTTNTPFALTKGGAIASAVGSYMKITSSFTRTDVSAIPKVNEISVSYYGTDNNVPYGKAFKDAYYLSVNTGAATSTNDCILVLQKNGEWTRYDNNAACLAVYRDNLYYGDSKDTGLFFRMEIEGLYSDNGNAYTSYWTSKKINQHPFYKTMIKDLWITSAGIAGDLDISYNFNDYSGTWYTDTVTLTATNGISVDRISLPSTYSRYFQFRVGNSSAINFRIKRLDLIYDSIPAAE